MSERFIEANLGVHTADGERVELALADGRLVVRFVDWQDEPRELLLPGTLAFRWQDDDGGGAPRDDTTYEVAGSAWLEAQLDRSGLWGNDRYRHYKLCFNAAGTLDVICQAVLPE